MSRSSCGSPTTRTPATSSRGWNGVFASLPNTLTAATPCLLKRTGSVGGDGFRSRTPAEIRPRIRRWISGTPDAPHVAVGAALPGVDGFRRSHRQAQNARRVAVAAGPAAHRVTAASNPAMFSAALVSTDLAEARAWVRETLGPLATDSENDALLRETLRVFLNDGCSYKAAADDLNLHSNSVKYRVQRAVDRRGRQITDDRLDVELALLVCHWFGAAVLEPDRRAKPTAK